MQCKWLFEENSRSAVHYLGMLVSYPLRTWQTLQWVLKNKADEKRDRKGPLGIQETKTILTPFRKRAALRCSSMSLKDS